MKTKSMDMENNGTYDLTSAEDTKCDVQAFNVDGAGNAALPSSKSPDVRVPKKKGGNKRKFTHEYCLTCKNYGRACPGRKEGSDGCTVCRQPRKDKGEKLRDCLWAEPDQGIFTYKQARAARKEALRSGSGQLKTRHKTQVKRTNQTLGQQNDIKKQHAKVETSCNGGTLNVVPPKYSLLSAHSTPLRCLDSFESQVHISYAAAESIREDRNHILPLLDEGPPLPVFSPLLQQESIVEPGFTTTTPPTIVPNTKPGYMTLAADDDEIGYLNDRSNTYRDDLYRNDPKYDVNVFDLDLEQRVALRTDMSTLKPPYPQPSELTPLQFAQHRKTTTEVPLNKQAYYLDPCAPLPVEQALPQKRANIVNLPLIPRPHYTKPRPLDLSGRKCRRWEKHGKKVTCITGVSWSLPKWRPKDESLGENEIEQPNIAQYIRNEDDSDGNN